MLIFTYLLYILLCLFFLIIISEIYKYFKIPSLNKKWIKLHERLPIINRLEKNKVEIKNIRKAKYKKDNELNHEVTWINKKIDLDKIKEVWFTVDNYDYLQSHVILSFKYLDEEDNEDYLSISYEIRKTKMWVYNPLIHLFKHHESFYIVSLEEDVVYLRTNIRKDKFINLFKVKLHKSHIIPLFNKIADDINLYSQKAFSYNIFYRNCLTETFKHFKELGIFNYYKFELFNVLKMLYNKNIIEHNFSNFDEFKKNTNLHYNKKLLPDNNFDIIIRNKNK